MKDTKGKVTIYCKGVAGNIVRLEGHLVRIVDNGTNGADVVYRKPRGRADYVVASYYSSFWLIVDGWGHPAPDSLFMPAKETAPGVTVAHARYRSCDPSWVADFFARAGVNLRVLAMFRDGVLQQQIVPDTEAPLLCAECVRPHVLGQLRKPCGTPGCECWCNRS
jgi:hypothetical protein